jgi:UDP-glucose 4-epimerase
VLWVAAKRSHKPLLPLRPSVISPAFPEAAAGNPLRVRVVVTGATGNVGTSVVEALAEAPQIESVLGLARRIPEWSPPKTEWASADVTTSDLAERFAGADAVVHLAWLIQPSHDQPTLQNVNVNGSERVFRAVAAANVPALVYASSVGAYAPGPKHHPVDESWPTDGIESSYYARHKAQVERLLDRFESDVPSTRVVRLRPALIFKASAAQEIRRLFAGPFLPTPLLHPRLIPLVPRIRDLRFQAVHSRDVGNAYLLALMGEARGAFNIAAEPVIGDEELAATLGARRVPVPAGLVRLLVDATWRLRLQPSAPGWLDMALGVPIMDTTRARTELGWEPRHTSTDALLELIEGIRRHRGHDTPPLASDAGGFARAKEIATGVGGRQ